MLWLSSSSVYGLWIVYRSQTCCLCCAWGVFWFLILFVCLYNVMKTVFPVCISHTCCSSAGLTWKNYFAGIVEILKKTKREILNIEKYIYPCQILFTSVFTMKINVKSTGSYLICCGNSSVVKAVAITLTHLGWRVLVWLPFSFQSTWIQTKQVQISFFRFLW